MEAVQRHNRLLAEGEEQSREGNERVMTQEPSGRMRRDKKLRQINTISPVCLVNCVGVSYLRKQIDILLSCSLTRLLSPPV